MSGKLPSVGESAQQLNNVVKLISEAQTLDSNGDELGAYRHYLTCVAQMAQTLSNDIQANQGQGTLSQHQCLQLFKMARNCLDRGEKIYSLAKLEQRPLALFRLATPSPLASPTQSNPPIGNGAPPSHSHAPLGKLRTWPENLAPPSRSLINVRAVGVGREDSVESSTASTTSLDGTAQSPRPLRQLSYMEQAKLRNQHMMEQYKALLRDSCTTNNLPSDVRLSMLRRLEENVGVAKIKEQAVARKLRERELRLQQEARNKSHASIVNLSVDELCDLVTSYEHGKSAITSIKAKLNTAGSNIDMIYSAISDILSMADHPLAKLLGEGQYSVYMILQPLVVAIEKAGGLPYLEIRLDNCGLDRKPSLGHDDDIARSASLASTSSVEQSTSLASRLTPNQLTGEAEDDDDLLDLLDEEDEDLLDLVGSQSLYSGQEPPTSHSAASGEPLYHVLEPPQPMPRVRSSTHSQREQGNNYQSFNFTSNEAYMRMDELPGKGEGQEPRYVSHESVMNSKNSSDEPVYANNEQERSGEFYDVPSPKPVSAEGEAPPVRRSPSLYEQLDNVKEKGHLYEYLDTGESTDGGILSCPPPEPEVVFKNLPPLVCAAHFGDEASLLKLSDTASSVIKEAIKIVQKILSTLEEVFVKCYPVLSSDDNQEVCWTVLETNFFPPLLQPLTLIYRCKNYQEECSTAKNMCQHVNATPKDLSVRPKFWLIEQAYAPYGEAIDDLRQLLSLPGPTPKLNGLVKMSKRIMKCIDKYYESRGDSSVDASGVGVDDMLPIISYIIIRSGLPQLVSQCSIMEEFIRDGYMRGEEGFCLTSFLTALKFVSHMSS